MIGKIKDFLVEAGILIIAIIAYILLIIIDLFLAVIKVINIPLNKLVNKIDKVKRGKQQYD